MDLLVSCSAIFLWNPMTEYLAYIQAIKWIKWNLCSYKETCTSREQTFDARLKWALVPAFFTPGTRDTFSPGWWLQPGLNVPATSVWRISRWEGPLVPVGATSRD